MNNKYQHIVDEVSNSKVGKSTENQLTSPRRMRSAQVAMFIRNNTQYTCCEMAKALVEKGFYDNTHTAMATVGRIKKEKNLVLAIADKTKAIQKMVLSRHARGYNTGTGKHHSQATKCKISKANKGRKFGPQSEERKAKARATSGNAKKVHTTSGIFSSQAEVLKVTGLTTYHLRKLFKSDPTNYYLVK
tara:strand:+ start:444 stop:1010 length:567 start_codon:yes stop_codon:yes gene_type:complete